MQYQELKKGISAHLDSAAEDFFMIGYYLRQISENALFLEDGYKTIWDFAKSEFGLSTSSASRFMAINARFSIDGGEHMAERYVGMGVSKLQEMLGLPDEELEKVTKETTVREIRAMKKKQAEPLSYFGLPKTVRPDGSLLTTPGCGDGKYDCFSCCRECGIRQEARQCRVSTCGNPKPCALIDNVVWKNNIQFSMYRDKCQMIHHELAPTRAGDGEPNPCCLTCNNETCFLRCDIAKQEDAEKKKEADREAREAQRAEEMKKPEPSERDIKAFYDWMKFKVTDDLSAGRLKEKYQHAGGGSTKFDYQGSTRGCRINYKREITWAQLAKRLKEIQQQEKEHIAEQEKRIRISPEQSAPDVIDADFREIEEEPAEAQEELSETKDEPTETNEDCEEEAEGTEENPQPVWKDPESYELADVGKLANEYEDVLKAYRTFDNIPDFTIRKQRILVDALEMLYRKLEEEADAYD